MKDKLSKLIKNKAFITILKTSLAILAIGFFLWPAAQHKVPLTGAQYLKAGKIRQVLTDTTYLELTKTAGYKTPYISFYYISTAASIHVLDKWGLACPCSMMRTLNEFSVVFSILFFLNLLWLFSLLFKVKLESFRALILFLSIPLIFTLFTSGNELPMAYTFFLIALNLSIWKKGMVWSRLLPAFFFTLAVATRIDLMLLLPALLYAIYAYRSRTDHEPVMRRPIMFLGFFSGFSLIYFFLFIRQTGQLPAMASLDSTHLKLFLSYWLYPFCISLVGLSIASFFKLYKTGHKRVLVFFALLALPHAIMYSTVLVGPSLIFPFAIVVFLAAGWLSQKLQWKGLALLVLLVAPWWFFSFTPYGIKASEGKYYYLPSADGPISTGNYLGTREMIRKGQYQYRFVSELNGAISMARLSYLMDRKPVILLGYTDVYHFVNNYFVRENLYFSSSLNREMLDTALVVVQAKDYTRLSIFPEESRAIVKEYLNKGYVKYTYSDRKPFPYLLQLNDTIPPNKMLGRRILFLDSLYNSSGAVLMNDFIAPYRPSSWISTKKAHTVDTAPIYQDSLWTGYDMFIDGAEIRSAWMPIEYTTTVEKPKTTDY